MYLKSIEVLGFKSFAQKIIFEFHNGITGIVGPNGSGKSNVADAVRWVLGEQSARQLRGGNMQDVIFAGTELRKKMSFASVAITLDNSDRKLPIDFQEITVTRRLYRSGESEYLLNGSICRLKDINELFYDTGIGKEGYSIIGQGQIDKILSGKPEDRRELFDEAAGIVKFKRRKNAAVKKLAEEEQNLVRVTDILSELGRQIGPLERQSETARIYLAKKEQLKVLDLNMFLLENDFSTKAIRDLADKLEISEGELETARISYDKTREEYDRLEEELAEIDQNIDDLREETQNNSIKKQQLEGQISVLEEQIGAAGRNEEHDSLRLMAVKEGLQNKQSELEELMEEQSVLKAGLKKQRKTLEDRESRLTDVQQEISECDNAVEDGKSEIIELLNSRANTRGEAQKFNTLLEQIEIRKSAIAQRILTLKSREAVQKADYQKAKQEYDAVTSLIESMNAECSRLDDEVHDLQDILKKQNENMEIGQKAFHREESRLESLRNMAERYDGFGNAIRRIMEQKDKTPGIHGVVADLIEVDKKYEIAIETALGGSIQNIVTDTDETAKRMIEFLKQNKYGRATFLPMSSMKNRNDFVQKEALKENGAVGIASGLVKADPVYSGVLSYLLGRILVVDTIDHAIAIGRKYKHTIRMVTLEGELLNPGGSMTGGAFKNNSNLLGRKREIEELTDSVAILKKDMEELQKSIADNRSRRNVLRDTIADFQEKLRSEYVSQNTAKMNLDRLQSEADEIREQYGRIRADQEDIRKKISDIQASNDRIDQELEASIKDEEELNTYIETRSRELEEYRQEEAALQKELEGLRIDLASLEQKEGFNKENLNRIEGDIKNLTSEEETLEQTLADSRTENESRKNQIETLKNAIGEYDLLEEKAKTTLLEWQKDKEERNKSHRAFFEKRDELSGQINLLDRECYRLRSQKEKLEESLESQINYIWEEYEMTPNSALSYRNEEFKDRGKMKKQVTGLKEEIRALGPVNVNAIEQYKEIRERHTLMSSQYEDIQKARESLNDIIRDLDDGMRRQFSERFKDIQREFDKAFKELFGGGKGTLELQEEEDILEAGILIISQPPGKKLQNMMQLSGGEKALTAIALLFAIQNLKPSPFCLLDEIEAALDDSNVGRFASYLQKLTKNTQFIIITHRRGTMVAADRLYGITMQEKGVSTLVSVDLVENQLS